VRSPRHADSAASARPAGPPPITSTSGVTCTFYPVRGGQAVARGL
jgi:hypothetical protein